AIMSPRPETSVDRARVAVMGSSPEVGGAQSGTCFRLSSPRLSKPVRSANKPLRDVGSRYVLLCRVTESAHSGKSLSSHLARRVGNTAYSRERQRTKPRRD